MGGITSATMEDTILPKAPPMMTPTANINDVSPSNAFKILQKQIHFSHFFILI